MTDINCRVEGCKAVFSTTQLVSENATFICREHAHLFDKRKNSQEEEPRFQDTSHCKLLSATQPDGTNHIKKQSLNNEPFYEEEADWIERIDSDRGV